MVVVFSRLPESTTPRQENGPCLLRQVSRRVLTFLFLALGAAGVKIEEAVEDTIERKLLDAAIRYYECLARQRISLRSLAREHRRSRKRIAPNAT
jgi:hypothetical protein